jgi:Ca-activated chloride channel homolog
MNQLQIEILPLRAAVRADAPVTQDVLLRITPARPPVAADRPPLNLPLILDRSGSMEGAALVHFNLSYTALKAEEQVSHRLPLT